MKRMILEKKFVNFYWDSVRGQQTVGSSVAPTDSKQIITTWTLSVILETHIIIIVSTYWNNPDIFVLEISLTNVDKILFYLSNIFYNLLLYYSTTEV